MKLASRDVLVIVIILTVLKLSLSIGAVPPAFESVPRERLAALGRGVYEVCGKLEIIREVRS